MSLYLGLMTGTSVDGIDLALVSTADDVITIVDASESPIPKTLTATLKSLMVPGDNEIDRLGHAGVELAAAQAEAVSEFLAIKNLAPTDIRAIGMHGQTVRHRPSSKHPFTLQIGDASVLAERTGIDVIADFRSRDIAAGGQGAPLVPPFHEAILGRELRQVVINIGGISNVTVLAGGGERGNRSVSGFDTGPGNALLDLWCEAHTGQAYDTGGAWAASGTVSAPLLESMLSEPYFEAPPPKSTGREAFTKSWLDEHLAGRELPAADVQATLMDLTAACIADGIDRWGDLPERAVVVGGGRRNHRLMERLQSRLSMPLLLAEDVGIDGDALEAAAFAWLAYRFISGLPGNATAVTGATGERILGALYPA